MMQRRDEEEAAAEPLLNSNSNSNSNINVNNDRNTEDALVGDESTVGMVEIREDEHLPGLPVEEWKSCFKFLMHFAKYILALLVFDIVNIIVVEELWSRKEWWTYNTWGGAYVSAFLFLNTVFFFLAANAIDRDVIKTDRQEELFGERGAENPQGCFGMDCNNYENIYGKVARKVDVWLVSACKIHRTTTESRPTGTSFLSHLCWILWAILLANTYADILELGIHQLYDTNTTQPTTNHGTIPPTVFSNISHFPNELQQWITNGWDYRYQRETKSHGFPINRPKWSSYEDISPPMLNDRMLLEHDDILMEIVSKNNSLIKIYHKDIAFPTRFIPVQNSIDKDDPARASQYCFMSKSTHFSSYNEAHCIQASAIDTGKASSLKNSTLNWKKIEYDDNDWDPQDNDDDERDVMVASYKDLVFFSRSKGEYYSEAIQLIPETMETSTIYRFEEHIYNEPNNWRPHRNFDFGLFNGICGFGLASYFLVSKRGLVSGFFPLAITLSLILSVLRDMLHGVADPEVRITLGTIFFLFLIYNDGNNTRIPAWVGKDALTWALYGWVCSFLLFHWFVFIPKYDRRWGYIEEQACVFLILIGVVLGHPTVQAVGYIMIVSSFLGLIFDKYFDFIDFLGPVVGGVGCVVIGNWITANKEMVYSRLAYAGWRISRWMYLKFGGSRPRYTSA